jgi:hypothetical protein
MKYYYQSKCYPFFSLLFYPLHLANFVSVVFARGAYCVYVKSDCGSIAILQIANVGSRS